MNLDRERKSLIMGVVISTLLFLALGYIMVYIPNPMVPGANIALHMIVPILAGYFYGPKSGAVVGFGGCLLATLLMANQFYTVGVTSLTIVGILAGWIGGKYRSGVLSALTIILAHAINMLILLRVGLVVIPPENIGVTLLGLASESAINIVAIILIASLLKRGLYIAEPKRW